MFLWVLFCVSLYDRCTYSMYAPYVNNITRPYYLNCCLFTYYLCWDMYKMLLSPDRLILYRTVLIIHHVVALYLNLVTINYISIIGDLTFLMECVSLFNFVSCKSKWLLYYRFVCTVCVRLPLSCFLSFYYHDYVVVPHFKPLLGQFEYYHFVTTCRLIFLFVLYDVYVIRKIYRLL
jgi:hypothetical protein